MGQVKYNNQNIGPQWFGLISLTGKKYECIIMHVIGFNLNHILTVLCIVDQFFHVSNFHIIK